MEHTASGLLAGMMVLVLIDVVLRNVADRPLPWGTEVLEVVLGAMVFLVYPVLAARGGHVTVDLIHVGPRLQRVQRVVAELAGAALFGLLAWCLARQALRAADYGDGTPMLKIPFSAVLGGMALLALLAALASLVRAVAALRRAPTGRLPAAIPERS